MKLRELKQKISATSQTKFVATYTYDELSRVKTRSYNDGTPAVAYFYDNETLPSGYVLPSGFTRGAATGRLVAVTYGGGSAGNYLSYDKLGRVTQSVQQTDGQNYGLSYQYNLSGGVIAETYPSGRIVRTAYDSVGRLSQVTGEKDGQTKSYASSFGYASQGALSKLKLGNGLWEHTTYDPKRLQVTEIGLGTSALDSSQLKLSYNYLATPNATTNNGDVLSQTISAPGINLTQSFTYDELNRLSTSQERQGSSLVWRENYSYDRYGNRRVNEAGTTPALVGANPVIDPATNRISSMVNNQLTGYQYDAVGNMTADPGHSYQYDGESRLVSYGAQTPASYTYDGAGRRVKKVVGTGSLAVTTTFVYDAGGKLIAEYATNTVGSETGTSYVTVDRLGSTRLLTQGVIPRGTQAAKARYDYLPFGEEIGTSYGNRSSAPGYNPPDNMRQKYTGYERDVESGLDFAQARYYANAQGRFTSADSVGGTATSPQTLNRYSYTGNNPVNNVDPSGHVYFGAQFNSSQSYGDEASPGEPDYAEAGMSQEMLEKYAGMKDLNTEDRAARVAESVAGLFDLGNVVSAPQNSGFNFGNVPFTEGQRNILASSYNRINQNDCENFINDTLAKYKVGKDFNSLEKLVSRARFSFYDVGADYTPSELGVDINNTILLRHDFVNQGATAVTASDRTNVFLSEKVFDRPFLGYFGRTADTPSYIVHELFHVAGIDEKIVDSQQLTNEIRENCRLLGSDPIILRH